MKFFRGEQRKNVYKDSFHNFPKKKIQKSVAQWKTNCCAKLWRWNLCCRNLNEQSSRRKDLCNELLQFIAQESICNQTGSETRRKNPSCESFWDKSFRCANFKATKRLLREKLKVTKMFHLKNLCVMTHFTSRKNGLCADRHSSQKEKMRYNW